MPTLRLDSTLQEYSFTKQEILNAHILTDLQIKRIHTRFAELFKERGSTPAPEEVSLDRSYFLKIAELDGKLGMLQELIDCHSAAFKELAATSAVDVQQGGEAIHGNLAQRAADLVNNQT